VNQDESEQNEVDRTKEEYTIDTENPVGCRDNRRRRRRFRIDRGGPLRGSSSPLWHFEPVRVKPN